MALRYDRNVTKCLVLQIQIQLHTIFNSYLPLFKFEFCDSVSIINVIFCIYFKLFPKYSEFCYFYLAFVGFPSDDSAGVLRNHVLPAFLIGWNTFAFRFFFGLLLPMLMVSCHSTCQMFSKSAAYTLDYIPKINHFLILGGSFRVVYAFS